MRIEHPVVLVAVKLPRLLRAYRPWALAAMSVAQSASQRTTAELLA
jgi:hypothetical protein